MHWEWNRVYLYLPPQLLRRVLRWVCRRLRKKLNGRMRPGKYLCWIRRKWRLQWSWCLLRREWIRCLHMLRRFCSWWICLLLKMRWSAVFLSSRVSEDGAVIYNYSRELWMQQTTILDASSALRVSWIKLRTSWLSKKRWKHSTTRANCLWALGNSQLEGSLLSD